MIQHNITRDKCATFISQACVTNITELKAHGGAFTRYNRGWGLAVKNNLINTKIEIKNLTQQKLGMPFQVLC